MVDLRTILLGGGAAASVAVLVAGCQTAGADEGKAKARVPPETLAAAMPVPVPAAAPVPEPAPVPPPPSTACPAGATLVEGNYCPDVEQTCLEWMDPPGSRYEHFRCARYAKPAVCKSKARRAMRYCIETTEHREPDSELPMHFTSWTDATRICKAAGMRLCTASEWQFACEGEEMRPYAYGWERDANACNVDIMKGLGHVGRLVDHRSTPADHPNCVSPFGVHDMVGNVDEWVEREGVAPPRRSALRGGWWLPGRNRCRAATLHHGEDYFAKQVGFRCCADVK